MIAFRHAMPWQNITRPALAAALLLGGHQATTPARAQGASAPTPSAITVPPAINWSAADVQTEQARCVNILRGLDIVAQPAQPIREHDCGAAAPIELISVGTSPPVTFYPTVTVTCDLAVALHKWITKDLQPLARQHLRAEIIRIDTMSSYSCRTAYGRKNARLSEHGKANAVDIRAFLTTTGASSEVLADWGPTNHEIAAQVAAAKKLESDRAMAAAAAANKTIVATRPPGGTGTGGVATSGVATGSLPAGAAGGASMPRPSLAIGPHGGAPIGLSLPSTSNTGLGLSTGIGQPAHLGGPKAAGGELAVGGKTDFLRAAHATACRVFGTVLGPEANAAHRNHFHVDMAERRLKSICE